jgi:4-diphosphocytidyl-2-C-methyl-D-erythritol kinase
VHAGSQTLAMLAHAKVNLFLAVGPRRTDGYHQVTTVMQAVGLADELLVEPGGDEVMLECVPDLGVPAVENLAWRAAEVWRRETGVGARVRLVKRVPLGAGLGGGSSDAAAVLAALATAGGADPGSAVRLAADLGADVPFFLGPGTALMGGRGDELLDVLPTPAMDVVLVNPGVPAPTAAVYAQLDRMLRPPAPPADAIVQALRSGDLRAIADAMHNDMEEAAMALVPEVRAALRFVEAVPGVLRGMVAGSGSSVFGVCEDEARARECARGAQERGWWACATRTSDIGVSIAPHTHGANGVTEAG